LIQRNTEGPIMLSQQTALFLRMLGPLIEVICLVLLFSFPGEDRTIAGMPLRWALYGGIGLGIALVIAGLTLVKRTVPTKRLDLD
jgi:hypothetical protein